MSSPRPSIDIARERRWARKRSGSWQSRNFFIALFPQSSSTISILQLPSCGVTRASRTSHRGLMISKTIIPETKSWSWCWEEMLCPNSRASCPTFRGEGAEEFAPADARQTDDPQTPSAWASSTTPAVHEFSHQQFPILVEKTLQECAMSDAERTIVSYLFSGGRPRVRLEHLQPEFVSPL